MMLFLLSATHSQSGNYIANGLQVIPVVFTGIIIFTHLADSKVFVSSRSILGDKTGVLVEESQVKSMESINMVRLFEKVKATPALSTDFEHRSKEQKTMVRFCIFFTCILRNSPYPSCMYAHVKIYTHFGRFAGGAWRP